MCIKNTTWIYFLHDNRQLAELIGGTCSPCGKTYHFIQGFHSKYFTQFLEHVLLGQLHTASIIRHPYSVKMTIIPIRSDCNDFSQHNEDEMGQM
jgi:hypothetical protein